MKLRLIAMAATLVSAHPPPGPTHDALAALLLHHPSEPGPSPAQSLACAGYWKEQVFMTPVPCNGCGEKPTIERLLVGDHQLVLSHVQNNCAGRPISIVNGEDDEGAMIAEWNELMGAPA